MKKVRLELDELRLQSFHTSDLPSQHRGTVNGHANPTGEVGCTAGDSCFATCAFNTVDGSAVCQSDACHDGCAQEAAFATFIGSGTA
jgi:hypothetical protein